MQSCEASIGQLKVEILDNEAQLAQTQEGLYKIRNTINILEQGIEHARQNSADLAAAKERDQADLSQLRSRQEDALKELNDLKALIGTSEDRIRELQQIVTEKNSGWRN